ncbi:d0266a38-8e71-4a10-8d62-d25e23382f79 [Thermothielavioides terrestris]|jgi:hypothetical protein
MNTN